MLTKPHITSIVFGIIIILGFGYFSLFNSSFLSVFILIAYIGYHKYNDVSNFGYGYKTALTSVFIASIIAFLAFTYKSYGPRDWDFTCFYLYGNVAANGMNFYSPDDYYSILKTLHIPIELNAGFIREVVDVGCPYPPPTLFLFSLLGFFSYDNALIFWTILNGLFLLGSIILIRNIFFKKKGIESVMISTALVLTFHSTLTTVFYSQILFILLFFLLLFYKYRDRPVAGLFLAVAIFLKPFAAILFFYLIIRRQYKTISVFIAGSLLISAIAALVYGFQPFMEYFFNNPNQRAPDLLFTESNNQSLLAELFRSLPQYKPIAKIIYAMVSATLLLLFGTLMFTNKNRNEIHDIFFVIFLSVALIIYPSGQYNYPIVHLTSVFILLNYFKRLDSSAVFVFLFYLVSYAGMFYLNIFLLLVCVLLVYKQKVEFIYSEIRHSLKSGT